MQSQPEIISSAPKLTLLAPSPQLSAPPAAPTCSAQTATHSALPIPHSAAAPELTVLAPSPETDQVPEREHRCHGKIARLPKVLRDRLNLMLDDGLPYRLIIQELQRSTDPPLQYPISEKDISRWYTKGYQRYLAHRDHLDYLHANREAASDMVANDDTTTLPEATLQVIASQYFDLLGDFSPDSLKQKLAEDPLKYTRFLNVFARLTREILNLKKHRDLCAQARNAELKYRDPNRELSEREDNAITERVDAFFKRRRRRPAAPPKRTRSLVTLPCDAAILACSRWRRRLACEPPKPGDGG